MSNPGIYQVSITATHLLVNHKTLRRKTEKALLRNYNDLTINNVFDVFDHNVLALNVYFEPNVNTLSIFSHPFLPAGYYSSTEVIE